MARKYDNLPGITLDLLDGNLAIDEQVTGPVVLIVDRSTSGPSNTQYLAADANEAAAIYGEGPLMERLSEVKMGGAKNIILYRIGGSAAEILDLFGSDTLIGTTEETSAAGSKYSIYLGPSPKGDGNASLIIFEGDRIVYSNVIGSEVDLAKFNVVGFDFLFTSRIGQPTQPVLLKDALAALVDDAIFASVGDGIITDFDLPVTGLSIDKVTLDGVPELAYTLSVGTGGGGVDQIIFTAAPANLAAISVEFNTPAVVSGALYDGGGNSLAASNKEMYELLAEAYSDLETTIATHLLVGSILDTENIADGSVDADRLDYLRTEEIDGIVSYYWDTDKIIYVDVPGTGETAVIGLAGLDDNGQPIIKYNYNEVNFAHQMGQWCHELTEDERFVLGNIGTSGPAANTTSAIAKWLGTLPQTDINGNIVVDGTGLLGNRFMAGSTTQAEGFFATDSGYPDGNIEVDANGAPIELGKFFSIVMYPVITPNSGSLGSVAQQINGVGIYAGLLSTVEAGDSTTNKLLNRVSLPFSVKKTKLDELSLVGYVSYQTKAVGTTVVSGELPTSANSDYDYISTSIIVQTLIRRIRERLEPFLGKGLNQITIAAADTAVEGIFEDAAKSGWIVKYLYKVLTLPGAKGRGRLQIPMTIVPAFELREINTSLKLAYDI
jgi:hypothetical protein